jgi:hypothetical protein
MALEAHLQTLNRRHQELEAALASEMKHPALDEERMQEQSGRGAAASGAFFVDETA